MHDPHQQSPAWFWNAAAEGVSLRGRSISSGTHCTDMVKNMSLQGPTKVCFTVTVNARTPQVVDMNARTSRFAIRLKSPNPPDCSLRQSRNPYSVPEPSEKDLMRVRKGSPNCPKCRTWACPNNPGSLFICRKWPKRFFFVENPEPLHEGDFQFAPITLHNSLPGFCNFFYRICRRALPGPEGATTFLHFLRLATPSPLGL